MSYVGIDVGKRGLEVAALGRSGEVQRLGVANDACGHDTLLAWLAESAATHVVLEATGSYHQRLLSCLQGAGVALSVVNPARASYFAKSQGRRNKTDRADALILALYARERSPTGAPAPALAQSLARELAALQDDLVRLKNRLEAAESGVSHPQVAASLKRRVATLEQEARDPLETLGHDTEQAHPEELVLLRSVPGIGLKTALLLLAELGDVRRFASAAKLVAFAGLTPQQTVSGTSVNRSRLSKLGSGRLRRLLYMPGLVAVRHNPPLKRFYERLLARGKSKKTALVAAMAKLLRIVFGVLTHRQPFSPDYATP